MRHQAEPRADLLPRVQPLCRRQLCPSLTTLLHISYVLNYIACLVHTWNKIISLNYRSYFSFIIKLDK